MAQSLSIVYVDSVEVADEHDVNNAQASDTPDDHTGPGNVSLLVAPVLLWTSPYWDYHDMSKRQLSNY